MRVPQRGKRFEGRIKREEEQWLPPLPSSFEPLPSAFATLIRPSGTFSRKREKALFDPLLSRVDVEPSVADKAEEGEVELSSEVDGKGENTLGIMLMELRSEYAKPKAKRGL